MPLRPGDTVEHFTIVSLLGKGGMGEVYVALDTRLRRHVALKIMHPGAAESGSAPGSDGASRLLREAQSAASLTHPNVVTIYEVGEIQAAGDQQGFPFIAMELVKGKTLRAFVSDPSIPVAKRVAWLTDIARALAAAHRARLIHRDVKPDNVMVSAEGIVKVLDFGLARRTLTPSLSSMSSTEAQLLPSLTGQGVALGTPYFMAPEQMRREPLDGRADQFSWGVVAYELLSGQPAWGHQLDALELVSKILSQHPPPLGAMSLSLPLHVIAVVERAMRKERADRFATMDEVVEGLEVPWPVLATPPAGAPATETGASPSPPVPVEGRSGRGTGGAHAGAAQSGLFRNLVIATGVLLAAGAGWKASRPSSPAAMAPLRADASIEPCVRNVDCAAVGASLVCSAGACVAPKGCVSNAECSARAGEPSVCHKDDGVCAPLGSIDCKVVADKAAIDDDATLWVATMFPRTGPAAAEFGDDNARGVELARDDVLSTLGGIPFVRTGSAPRPIALLACDDANDPTRIAWHLVRDARVPAVIGFRTSKEAVGLATEVFVPNHVLTITAPNRSASLSTFVPDRGEPQYVRRTTPGPAAWAAPLSSLVADVLEPSLRASHDVDDERPMRVALIRPKNESGVTVSYALSSLLRFNGKSAAQNGSLFRDVILDDDGSDADFDQATAALLDLKPNVVVYLTSPETRVLRALEAKLGPRDPAPRYVSIGAVRDGSFYAFLRADPARRRRFYEVRPSLTTVANSQLASHFNDVFKVKYPFADLPSASYDAGYLVVYAAEALDRGALTGSALARAIDRLQPPAAAIDVGPARLFDGFSSLRAGQNVDLNGTFSRLDYAGDSPDPASDFVVYCAETSAGEDGRESGLRFDAARGAMTGTLHCR